MSKLFKSQSFVFSLICVIIVLLGGGYDLVKGILASNVISIIIGTLFLLLGIAGLIEYKGNRDDRYERSVEDRVRNSFFGD